MEPDGEFTQAGVIYEKDGGHAMAFTDGQGKRRLVLHTPNVRTIFGGAFEHAVILDFDKIFIREN